MSEAARTTGSALWVEACQDVGAGIQRTFSPPPQDDFAHVMVRATASVAKRELERFEEWTREFGEEGV